MLAISKHLKCLKMEPNKVYICHYILFLFNKKNYCRNYNKRIICETYGKVLYYIHYITRVRSDLNDLEVISTWIIKNILRMKDEELQASLKRTKKKIKIYNVNLTSY